MQKPWKAKAVSNKHSPGTLISRGPEGVCSHDSIAQRFGKIISVWANTERYLVEIFSYLIEMEEWIAADMFEQVRGPKARFHILKSSLAKKFGKDVADQLWVDILEPIWEMAADRDLIAHGGFITCSAYPDAVIRVEGWGKQEAWYLYDISMLDALLAEMRARAGKIMILYFQVIRSTPIRYETGRLMLGGHPEMACGDRRRKDRRATDSQPSQIQAAPKDPQS